VVCDLRGRQGGAENGDGSHFGATVRLGPHASAQDGHVLCNPDFGPLLAIRLKGNPWA
jgi:hypothetical protein